MKHSKNAAFRRAMAAALTSAPSESEHTGIRTNVRSGPRTAGYAGALLLVTSTLLAGPAFGQVDQPQKGLLAALDSFEVLAVSVPHDEPRAFHMQVTSARFTWTLALDQRSVWEPDAKAIVLENGSVAQTIPLTQSRTYRGQILEVPGSRVSAAFTDEGFHAVLRAPDVGVWVIEPTGLADGLSVLYRPGELAARPRRCGVSGAPLDASDVAVPPSSGVTSPDESTFGNTAQLQSPGRFVCELAIDADFAYFQRRGSSVSATYDEIAMVINAVNEVYETDVDITHGITNIVIRTDAASNPYTSTSASGLLSAFQTEWNTNQSQLQFDLAHLFTGVDLDGNTIGLAFVGVVCSASSPYGISQDWASLFAVADLVSHELGHNWSAGHCDESTSCDMTLPCYTMNSGLSASSPSLRFGVCSQGSITSHRDTRTCLDVAPASAVWVQFRDCGMTCGENGTFGFPTSSLSQAIAQGAEPLTVYILPGSTADAPDDSFPMTIDKHVILNAFQGGVPPAGGVVRIGD